MTEQLDHFLPEEQREKNLELPLFELEQRVEKLEKSNAAMQVEMIDKLATAVSHKFNLHLSMYLPNVAKKLADFAAFKERTALRLQEQGNVEASGAPTSSADL